MLYTSIGVIIGITIIVAILTISLAGQAKIYGELDKYGANLMVMPAISDVDIRLGDLSLGTLAVGDNYISEDKLPEIRRITDDAIRRALRLEDEYNIATIAPKLYVSTEVKGMSIMVVALILKKREISRHGG